MVSLIGGALGGALHGIASLTAHVAAGDFAPQWTMWYLANPFVGASLATVFLFVLQAGLGGQAAPTSGGLYGIAAVATLTGLFSRHALKKLKEIFDVAFASGKSETGITGAGTTGIGTGTPATPTPSEPTINTSRNPVRFRDASSLRRSGTGREEMTSMNDSAQTQQGHPEALRPEARPLEYARLDEQQQVALTRVVGLLTAATANGTLVSTPSSLDRAGGGVPTAMKPGPYLEAKRSSRNILIGGSVAPARPR
jgi:hypothetical protein